LACLDRRSGRSGAAGASRVQPRLGRSLDGRRPRQARRKGRRKKGRPRL